MHFEATEESHIAAVSRAFLQSMPSGCLIYILLPALVVALLKEQQKRALKICAWHEHDASPGVRFPFLVPHPSTICNGTDTF